MKHLLLFSVIAMSFISCAEEEVDTRVNFLGSYHERVTATTFIDGEYIDQTSYDEVLYIKNGESTDEIILEWQDGSDEVIVAFVSGSSFTIPSQTMSLYSPSENYTYIFSCSGSGRLTRGKITYEIEMQEKNFDMLIRSVSEATPTRTSQKRATRADWEKQDNDF